MASLRTHVNRAFRIPERIPQEGCFHACLCPIDGQRGLSLLTLFCYPSQMETEVRNILCSKNESLFYGSGNSLEPLYAGDVIDVKLLKGLEACEGTEEDELKLR